ncbi:FimV/HubP family polar landmark protein [Massilia eurypsychrophila]|uniref:FimV/HubP family polar landmark protein n=1 Tax=Massilia eurypsychrophila TaxID=1485217 RepID=UPI0027D7B0AB|nr:FimV/HubP family polar landmark protein [Massilia eurypsychrophila]
MFLSSAACAAGLGKLTVLSSLGQPLRAEIELTSVSNDEAAGLVAKLAAPEAFRQANIEFNPALLSLRFAVEQRNGRQFIKISSLQPVNEPFVDMLLELSWNSGRLVREYTFLLDPAELRTTQSAQVAAPVDVLNQGSRTSLPARQAGQPTRQGSQASQTSQTSPASQPAPAAQAPQPRPKLEQPTADNQGDAGDGASKYKVKRGDTLGRIAAQVKPVEISLDMMLVALYRANPDAFISNNMNRLKSGQILSVPDSDAIKGGGEGDARGVVVAHAADFNAYRNKLAGQVANAAPGKETEGTQSGAGKIVAKVEERPTAANESKDQLKLSKAAPAGAAGKTGAVDAEDKIAKERALAEATARVKELERNVSDLEKLMTVKNKAGTEAQVAPVSVVTTPAAAVAARPAAEVMPAPAPVEPAKVKPAPVVVKQPAPAEPTFADMIMDNITYVGAGLAVALLALFGLSRRRKKDAIAPGEPSILGAPTDQAHSLFAETGGQSIDTSNSVFNSSFAPSASQLDTNEVDPVAEADVYIAYGRDAQAEEILKEALRNHPERAPVRLKLLEIYAARKDQRAFEAQAGEMYGITRGQGDEWAQAAALGLSIDPHNPLYATAGETVAAAASSTPEDIAEQAILNQMHAEGVSAEPDLMDLGLADNTPTALPEPVQSAASPADDHTLDFDLGGLSFEPVTNDTPAPASTVAAAPAFDANDMEFTSDPVVAAAPPKEEEQSFDLAFDMAFDTPDADKTIVAAVPAEPVAEPKSLDDIRLDMASHEPVPEFNMADLAHEFDLPTLPDSTPAAAPVAAKADDVANFADMDFDFPTTPAAPAAASAAPVDDPFALPDFPDVERTAVPAAAQSFAAAPQFDMSGIDLDLPADAPAFEETGASSSSGEMTAMQMEMETKLDLAIAYEEIGDKEGARELLDEVIKGGSNEQVSKASAMRSKLA